MAELGPKRGVPHDVHALQLRQGPVGQQLLQQLKLGACAIKLGETEKVMHCTMHAHNCVKQTI